MQKLNNKAGKKLKILINTIPLLTPLTGIGNYAFQIASCLRQIDKINAYYYFYGWYSRNLKSHDSAKKIYEFIKKTPFIGRAAAKAKHCLVYSQIRKSDIYFEPNFIPLDIRSEKVVATIHDFSWKLFPKWHPPRRVEFFEKNFWKKINRADRIIAVSNFTKAQAVDRFDLPKEKITVIYNGFDSDIFKPYNSAELEPLRKKYALPQDFILFVGSVEPRKNLINLIYAYTALDKSVRKKFKLVLPLVLEGCIIC